MSIKVVLFDLDGSLLPMDQEVFIKTYLEMLVKNISPHGYQPELLADIPPVQLSKKQAYFEPK